MKKSFKFMAVIAVIICLVIAFAVTANAETYYQEGIYVYTVSKGQATIYDCEYYVRGDLEIPSTLGGYPVVAIDYRAFMDMDEMTSVVMPDTITSIGVDAFYGCMKLESVTFSKNLNSIGEFAFYYCPNLNNVVIPSSVRRIADYAFAGCYDLTDITIENGVTTFGYRVFYDCKGLETISLPDSITSMDIATFAYCDNLKKVKLPANLTEIPMETFTQCYSLTDVTMPKNVTVISYAAFNSCEALKSIEIPATVQTISDAAFYQCESLKYVYFGGTREDWAYDVRIETSNDYLIYATIFYNGEGPVASQFAVTYKLRCTASIDNTAKTLTAKWDGSSTKTMVFKINANVAGGDTLEVSDIVGGTVSLNNNVLTVAPNNANVNFKVKIIEDSGAVTVLNATANFGYPNFILDSTMVKNVVRASTSIDGATINVVTQTGEQTSSMRVKFALPAGATLSVANGADKTYLEEHSATVLEVKNPGVGRLTVPMVLKDSDGVTMPMTL
ncbi:MAG: leucine-rich repeat domain-containing protein, partial [Clostridia bacterium]|nr:leucine-rich repeat domain-containing protein [Clostridia bacterium]